MRARNRTEQYLHDRIQALFDQNPDPILSEVALGHLVEEVATACGLFIGEIRSTEKFSIWVGAFLDKLVDVRAGKPQAVYLGPDPAPKAVPPAPPEQAGLPGVAERKVQTYTGSAARGPAVGRAYLSGAEINAARERLGWTQRRLGKEIGSSGSYMSNLENGVAMARQATYVALRGALALPLPEETA